MIHVVVVESTQREPVSRRQAIVRLLASYPFRVVWIKIHSSTHALTHSGVNYIFLTAMMIVWWALPHVILPILLLWEQVFLLVALHKSIVSPKKHQKCNDYNAYTDAQDDPQVVVLLNDWHEFLAPIFLLVLWRFQVAKSRQAFRVCVTVIASCLVALTNYLLRAKALWAASTRWSRTVQVGLALFVTQNRHGAFPFNAAPRRALKAKIAIVFLHLETV